MLGGRCPADVHEGQGESVILLAWGLHLREAGASEGARLTALPTWQGSGGGHKDYGSDLHTDQHLECVGSAYRVG